MESVVVVVIASGGAIRNAATSQIGIGQDRWIIGSARARCDVTTQVRWVGATHSAAATASTTGRSCANSVSWP